LQTIIFPGFDITIAGAAELTGISVPDLEKLFAGCIAVDQAFAGKLSALGVDPKTMLNMKVGHYETAHL